MGVYQDVYEDQTFSKAVWGASKHSSSVTLSPFFNGLYYCNGIGWLHVLSWFKSILPMLCCNRANKSTNDLCSKHPNFYGKFNFYPFYDIMSTKFSYQMEQQLWPLNTSGFKIVSWKMSDLHQTSTLNQIKGKFRSPTLYVWMRTSTLIEKQTHNLIFCFA